MNPYTPAYAVPMLADESWLTQGVLSRRVIGWAIDAIILSVVCSVAWAMTGLFGILTLGLGMPLMGALPIIPLLYGWLFLASSMAATPGQAMMGLTVRRDVDLQRPESLQALAFVLAYCATIALGAVWLAIALFTTRKRAPHDLISGLVVVRARALT
jgi:uncharacterized RDD family membrane protein YckC